MGTVTNVTWSWSRSKTLNGCPRAHFWSYYFRGEPEESQARALKSLVSMEMLAGQAVDWTIDSALDRFRQDRTLVSGLAAQGLQTFRRLIESSPVICLAIKSGRPRPSNSQPLFSDYYDEPAREGLIQYCEQTVQKCLTNFEQSETLDRILSIDSDNWNPSKGDSVPWFEIPNGGPKVYASYDLYVRQAEGSVLVIDWKSGKVTAETSKDAADQLAVYVLFAVYRLKVPPDQVQVMSAWLRTPLAWTPESLPQERIQLVRKRIIDEWQGELEGLTEVETKQGRAWSADRKSFPPRPDSFRCARCNFRAICPEGSALLSPSDTVPR